MAFRREDRGAVPPPEPVKHDRWWCRVTFLISAPNSDGALSDAEKLLDEGLAHAAGRLNARVRDIQVDAVCIPYVKKDTPTMSEEMKTWLDSLSVGTVVATITNLLPAIAALFTIVWTTIRIYETRTVQKLLDRKQKERRGDE